MRSLTDALAMTSSFSCTKQRLADAAMLFHPVPGVELRMNTDASTKAIAGAIHQVVGGNLQPLGFFSHRTSAAEARYSAYDLELLAIYSTLVNSATCWKAVRSGFLPTRSLSPVPS